jgi:hypothetical protein
MHQEDGQRASSHLSQLVCICSAQASGRTPSLPQWGLVTVDRNGRENGLGQASASCMGTAGYGGEGQKTCLETYV